MSKEEIQREKLVRFIKSNNPFYLFANLDGHTMEQLEKLKSTIESEIKSEVMKNKFNLSNISNN